MGADGPNIPLQLGTAMVRHPPRVVFKPPANVDFTVGIPICSRGRHVGHKIIEKGAGFVTAQPDHRTHQYSHQMGGQGILAGPEPMMVVVTISQPGHGIAMGRFSFGAADFQRAVARIIEPGMVMQDIERTAQTFGGLDIRTIGHAHHKAFRVRVRSIFITGEPAFKDIANIFNAVEPMGGHGQCISYKETP